MKRIYIIAGLLGLLGMIAGGIVFFSPQYRLAYYASQVERDLKDHPAGGLIRVVFPDEADQESLARAVAEVWIAHGYAPAMYRMELTVLYSATPLVTRSIPQASAAAVNKYMRLSYEAFERLADTDPDSCGVITGHPLPNGVQDVNMALITVMSPEEKSAYFGALTEIITSARSDPDYISLKLNQIFDFIHDATEKAVERMGKERAAKSLTATPEHNYDPCLIQSYIMQNLLEIGDPYRADVFKVQMVRGSSRKIKQNLPPANPAGVPPGNKAPVTAP